MSGSRKCGKMPGRQGSLRWMRSVLESVKTKRKECERGGKKKQKLEAESGVVWGEDVSTEYIERNAFLYFTQAESPNSQRNQGTLITYYGLEWMWGTSVTRVIRKPLMDKSIPQ